MLGRETRHLIAPGKGSNKSRTVCPEQLLPSLSCRCPPYRHSWPRARVGLARRCDHPKGCLSASPLWSRSLIHSKVAQPQPFPSLSLFLINSLEPPGAVGCCRADKSHFRPVLALKGGRRDECVLGAQSPPPPATWGLAAPEAPVAESPGTVPSHWPQLPLRVLAAEARMGREEKRSYRRRKGEGQGRGGGGGPQLSSPGCQAPAESLLHPDSALRPAHRRYLVSVVRLSQVYLRNQVSGEGEERRMSK